MYNSGRLQLLRRLIDDQVICKKLQTTEILRCTCGARQKRICKESDETTEEGLVCFKVITIDGKRKLSRAIGRGKADAAEIKYMYETGAKPQIIVYTSREVVD